MGAIVQMPTSDVAVFRAPSGIETVVVLAPSVSVRDVFTSVLENFIDRFKVPVLHWDAGARAVERKQHSRQPTSADLMLMNEKTVTCADLTGNFSGSDRYCFGGALILAHDDGEDENDTYGYRECTTIHLSSGSLTSDASPDRTRRVIDSHLHLVRALIDGFPVLRAHIYRDANNYAPSPPDADPSHILYIANRNEIAAGYDDPDVYWKAWDKVEPFDDERVLVTKGLSIDDELTYKQAVYPRTWELARHAKPKRTEYFAADIRPHDQLFFDSGEPALTQMGYHPNEQWIEYTAYVEEDQHIQPREILAFSYWLRRNKLPDGRPLKEVRVTFPDRAMAEREKRPLLDVGCRVLYYSEQGELSELTE